MPKPPLTVSGKCPTCKTVVTATAAPGRATWRGSCTKRGCTGTVYARRQPNTAPPASPAEPDDQAPTADQPRTPRKRTPRPIPKVTGYEQPAPHRPSSNDGPPPDVQPAGENPRPGPPGDGKPARRGLRDRLKRPPRAVEPEAGDTRHPYGHLGYV